MNETNRALKRPRTYFVARASDRLSFLYLERCTISQDQNGTIATIGSAEAMRTAALPTAVLSCLLLGPGTSITQASAAALADSGTTICFVGGGSARSYVSFAPFSSGGTRLLERQARIVADPDLRLAAAKRMYRIRFGTDAYDRGASLEQLRGWEGVRVKAQYADLTTKYRLGNWTRATRSPTDGVNQALNAANTALYGVTQSMVSALGVSSGLGVIHTGHRLSFVLDVADLYKSALTVPLAFSVHSSPTPVADVHRRFREGLVGLRLIQRMVEDIEFILGIDSLSVPGGEWVSDHVDLWTDGLDPPSWPYLVVDPERK